MMQRSVVRCAEATALRQLRLIGGSYFLGSYWQAVAHWAPLARRIPKHIKEQGRFERREDVLTAIRRVFESPDRPPVGQVFFALADTQAFYDLLRTFEDDVWFDESQRYLTGGVATFRDDSLLEGNDEDHLLLDDTYSRLLEEGDATLSTTNGLSQDPSSQETSRAASSGSSIFVDRKEIDASAEREEGFGAWWLRHCILALDETHVNDCILTLRTIGHEICRDVETERITTDSAKALFGMLLYEWRSITLQRGEEMSAMFRAYTAATLSYLAKASVLGTNPTEIKMSNSCFCLRLMKRECEMMPTYFDYTPVLQLIPKCNKEAVKIFSETIREIEGGGWSSKIRFMVQKVIPFVFTQTMLLAYSIRRHLLVWSIVLLTGMVLYVWYMHFGGSVDYMSPLIIGPECNLDELGMTRREAHEYRRKQALELSRTLELRKLRYIDSIENWARPDPKTALEHVGGIGQ